MSKASLTCPSCGEETVPDSEFCMNCGHNLGQNAYSEELVDDISESKREREYKKWKQSVPYTISSAIFLIFIDLVTGPGIQWAYWAVVPIFLFAVLAPYFSYKIGGT